MPTSRESLVTRLSMKYDDFADTSMVSVAQKWHLKPMLQVSDNQIRICVVGEKQMSLRVAGGRWVHAGWYRVYHEPSAHCWVSYLVRVLPMYCGAVRCTSIYSGRGQFLPRDIELDPRIGSLSLQVTRISLDDRK